MVFVIGHGEIAYYDTSAANYSMCSLPAKQVKYWFRQL